MARSKIEIIIEDTHRGIWYEDGVLVKVSGSINIFQLTRTGMGVEPER